MLCALAPFVHATIVLDDDSTDGTASVAPSACNVAAVISKPKGWWRVGTREETSDRNALLRAARGLSPTHIVALDGDEVLSAALLQEGLWWRLLGQLQVGQTLALPWLRVWKGGIGLRVDALYDDAGVYSPARGGGQRLKGFAWADDGSTMYSGDFIHTTRSPAGGSTIIVDDIGMGLLHLQFVNWQEFVLKQVWYKMVEAQRSATPVAGIALKYRFSLDFTHERVFPLHPAMTSACSSCWAQLLQHHSTIAPRCSSCSPASPLNWRVPPLVEWLNRTAAGPPPAQWPPVSTGAVEDVLKNHLFLEEKGAAVESCQQPQQLQVLFLAPAFSETDAFPGEESRAGSNGDSNLQQDEACADWDFEPFLRGVALAADLLSSSAGLWTAANQSTMVNFRIVMPESETTRSCPEFTRWLAAVRQLQRQHPKWPLHVDECSCGPICSIPAQLSCSHGSSTVPVRGVSSSSTVALLPFEYYRFTASPFCCSLTLDYIFVSNSCLPETI
jgi:hypothetical protein